MKLIWLLSQHQAWLYLVTYLSPSFSLFVFFYPGFLLRQNLTVDTSYFSVIPSQTPERTMLSLSQLRSFCPSGLENGILCLAWARSLFLSGTRDCEG